VQLDAVGAGLERKGGTHFSVGHGSKEETTMFSAEKRGLVNDLVVDEHREHPRRKIVLELDGEKRARTLLDEPRVGRLRGNDRLRRLRQLGAGWKRGKRFIPELLHSGADHIETQQEAERDEPNGERGKEEVVVGAESGRSTFALGVESPGPTLGPVGSRGNGLFGHRASFSIASAWGLVFLFSSISASAHDLWILPGKFRPAAAEPAPVFIGSGDRFPESAALVDPERLEDLVVHTVNGRAPLPSPRVDRTSLVADCVVPQAGTAVVTVSLKPHRIRLSADDFNAYLAEDGLPHILRSRGERDESGRPARERYSKWAKTILQVGEGADELWSQPVGLKLEIVPLTNPFTLSGGDEVSLYVAFDGIPLPGVIVTAARAGGEPSELKGWTDVKGRLTLKVPEAGRWYVHVVHMVRLENDPESDWESFWSTLTFEVSP